MSARLGPLLFASATLLSGGCGMLVAGSLGLEDATRPGTAQMDAGARDVAVLDTAELDVVIADMQSADLNAVDLRSPDLGRPDSTPPDTRRPDTWSSAPDAWSPDRPGSPDVSAPDGGVPDWYNPSYHCRIRLGIEMSLVTEALVDFPLLVELDPSLLNCGGQHSVPNTVLFVDSDQVSELAFEVELDQSPLLTTMWVRKPLLHPDSLDDHIWLYFGNTEGNDNTRQHETWSPEFRGVWHLTTKPSVYDWTVDSTGGAHHALIENMTDLDVVNGRAGGALSFSDWNARLQIDDHPDLDFGTTSFTYSLWVLVSRNVADYDVPWHKGGSEDSQAGYDMELGSGDWQAWISDGYDAVIVNFDDSNNINSGWHHLAVVVDRSDEMARAYLDGVASDESSIASLGSLSSTYNAYIGADHGRAYPFDGIIDEVRVEAGARSAGWIRTNHYNLLGELMQVGPVETLH